MPLIETRAKMKAKERPVCLKRKRFVIEAAHVLLDYAKLQAKP